ncbi:MAG: chemotaxis protein CheW [Hyphomicrobiaceae bacterium]
MTESISAVTNNGDEYVAVLVSNQNFCMEIMSIREIRGWTQETPLPHAPNFVRGVVNLRGTVLPIIDLADRLGLGRTVPKERHVIVIAQLGEQLVGLLVEAVADILTVTEDDVQPAPDVASEMAKRFVRGVVARDDRMIKILHLEEMLPKTEQEAA